VVTNANDPVPSKAIALEAVEIKEPLVIVMLPIIVALPVKVSDPDMTGEYIFIAKYKYWIS
jgi:hypothetical protein